MNFEQGDIVLTRYPHADFSSGKKRPALVISNHTFNAQQMDLITCLITSNLERDPLGVIIEARDLVEGTLPVTSRIKPYRIFTTEKTIIDKKLGKISKQKLSETFKQLQKVFVEQN
jgi:mRNA interferase MazF